MSVIGVIALTGLGLYVGLMILLYGMQSRLIHLPGVPGRELMATPADIGLQWEDVQIRTEGDVSLHGWYLPAPEDGAGYTVAFFHGNAGNISHRLDSLEIFHELGLATLIIDYRGYGRSEGSPSEEGLYRDGDAAWRYLVDERNVPPGKVIAFGRSLGAAVAGRVAAEHEVGGVILESSFTSAVDRGAELYPIFPVRLLARIHYPTRDFVRDVDAPVLVVHSPEDEIIPIHHGRAVYEAAPAPKQFLEIRGDHNTGFLQSRERYARGIADWLRALER